MTEQDILQIFDRAKAWTIEAGDTLKRDLYEKLTIEYKTSAADIVTQKDKEIEQFFVERITKDYPSHYIMGEEGVTAQTSYDPEQEVVWIIDPIDGTTNFVHQKRDFAVSVGIYMTGRPTIGIIYDPVGQECFYACQGQGAYLNGVRLPAIEPVALEEAILGVNHSWLTPNDRIEYQRLQALICHVRGTRAHGSSALEMAYVACGRLDMYLTMQLYPWDCAAGIVLLQETGASISTAANQPVYYYEATSIFVAHPSLHQQVVADYLLSEEAPGIS